jgi:hypothetical protein
MGLARSRDVLVKTSTPTSTTVRFGVAASALSIAISWPNAANAEVAEAPPHRVEFTVSPALPKCNDYDAFYGILVNWVRVRSIDPTANRKLVVAIKRQPDGVKRVDLSILDAEGAEVVAESHAYSATEECFKVLYWTAFDAAKLLRTTAPPPVEEPPMSVDKLVQESERGSPSKDKPPAPAVTVQIVQPPAERAQCEVTETRPQTHLLLGAGVTMGLTRTTMLGLRIGAGRSIGPLVLEGDVRVYPPLMEAEWNVGAEQKVTAAGYAVLGSAGLCLPGGRLLACLVATGGVVGYSFEKPYNFDERFLDETLDGAFDVGLRVGARFDLSRKLALRLDLEATAPIYRGNQFAWEADTERDKPRPALSGFFTVVPSF